MPTDRPDPDPLPDDLDDSSHGSAPGRETESDDESSEQLAADDELALDDSDGEDDGAPDDDEGPDDGALLDDDAGTPGDALNDSIQPHQLPDLTESMQLLLEAQKGNREALNDLLARYEDRIRRIVRVKMSYRLRRCVETVDIVQDAFAKAARAINTLELRSTASILQWLARIAENQMLDVHRRNYGLKRDKTRELRMATGGIDKDDPSPGVITAAQGPGPDDIVATEELRRIVDEGVSKLPEDYREVIMLRTYYGGSWEWVAEQMGRPGADAARQLHRRARIRLSRLLRDKLPDLPEPGGPNGD